MLSKKILEIISTVAAAAPFIEELLNYDDPNDPDKTPELQDLKEHLSLVADDCRAIIRRVGQMKGVGDAQD